KWGQTRKSAVAIERSAFPSTTDSERASRHFRLVPKPEVASLLDDLVSPGQQDWRHGNAQRRGGFEVDRKLEPCRLHHGQVGRLFTLENSAGINTRPAIGVGQAGSVAEQTAE